MNVNGENIAISNLKGPEIEMHDDQNSEMYTCLLIIVIVLLERGKGIYSLVFVPFIQDPNVFSLVCMYDASFIKIEKEEDPR